MSSVHSKWVKLNVGGELFQTTRSNLMSCPNSMLATMFDPDSGMEPGYSENGVYFLDVNPKYFSVILDWLRHRKVMADNDTNLDNVAEVAKFFGLQELVEELKMRGGVVVTSDDGEATEFLGDCMGLYLKETDSWFRQAGGEMYLYQHSNGNWYINDILHDDQGFLFNTTFGDSQILPRYGWQFLEKESGEFKLDEKLKINDASKIEFCNTITLSSSKFLNKDLLGEFYRAPEEWHNGWPVFKNKTGMKLHVSTNMKADQWYVSDFSKDENFISSGRATSCPAHPKSSLSELYGHKYWQYWSDGDDDGAGHWIEDETFKVECDVHTFDQ